MPITLPPISRRRFLAGSLAAGAGLMLGSRTGAADVAKAVDPHRFALLSDTHVAADRARLERGTNMTDNLVAACRQVLAGEQRPAMAFVSGDLAFKVGLSGDYATLVDLVRPLREAGLPVHLGLGNHDHRENFRAAFPTAGVGTLPVEGRVAMVIESPRANWFLLDSLDATNKTPGVLGERQVAWLVESLDARKYRPAIIVVHHNPDPTGKAAVKGITDTAALFDAILPRTQVKAVLYGHTHKWELKQQDGVHLVNLPPVAYTFGAGLPNGWVDARLADDALTLELRCLDPKHPKHGEKHALKWR